MSFYFSVRKIQVQTFEGKTLLHPISFEVDQGKIIGVYGSNGSGKTTLLKSLAGVNRNFQIGEVWVDGAQITASQNPEIRVQNALYLGSDFQTPFEVKVKELIEMGRTFSSKPQNIEDITTELGTKILNSRIVSTLSDGEKQWVMFTRALVQNPKVLILDESFSKLDLDRLLQAASILRKQAQGGMTIIIVQHDLNFLSEVSDQILLMQNGKLLHMGDVTEVLSERNLKELYPHVSLNVVKSPFSGKEKIIY